MKSTRILIVISLFFLLSISCEKPTEPDQMSPNDRGGSLEVLSTPANAMIIFNGNTVGNTPDTLTGIKAGTYSINLSLLHYSDYSTTVTIDSGKMSSVNATLFVLCTGEIIGDLNQPPEIDFINLQPGDGQIYGIANNIDANKIRVVLWALTNKWYVQPTIANPYTTICDDGSWHNWTHGWQTMVAVLVDSTYTPGSTRHTHPALEDGVLAFAQYPAVRSELPIQFSGYTWGVKQSADRFDPGPNYWSATEDNIWVDEQGLLHLQIFKDGDKWTCPEVYLLESHGYGKYTFELASRVDNLDPNTVFGCFTYESTSRELDIEFSKILASPHNSQYVIQPYTHSGNIFRYDMLSIAYSTHQIEWSAGQVVFSSWRGLSTNPDSLITSWIYTGNDIPPANIERFRFNLWLFGGNTPTTGIGDEVVIRSFNYMP